MRKTKKIFAALLMVIILAIPNALWASAASPTPEELGLIPVRQFFTDLGGEVEWLPETRAIFIAIDGGTVVLFAGETRAYTNDVPLTLETGVIIMQNTAFLTLEDLMLLLEAFIDSLPGLEMITLELTEEARDIALEDFDYLVNFTLANSAWDNIAYRRLGIDFDAHVAAHRHMIENMVPITVPYLPMHFPVRDCDEPLSVAANYLIHLLNWHFAAPLGGVGHLGVRDITMYRILLAVTQRGYHSEFATEYTRAQIRTAFGAYVDPRAIWFYGEYEFDLDGDEGGFPEIPGNIVTDILVPDEVAYLRINSFMGCRMFDSLTIFPFLQEVQDFDHLILDLRGNTGGDASYFWTAIVMPLAREAGFTSSYQFFAGGEGAVNLMDVYLQLFRSFGLDEEIFYAAIYPISDVVNERGLVHFNPEQYERLSYVFVVREYFDPNWLPDEIRVPFEGEIWLLVDEMSMSASVEAAQLAISSGFATVVGENTSGITGPFHTYIVLPNTGIIWRVDIGSFTDNYGRSIEVYGVTPQIRNFAGMDALETVLAVIEDLRGVEDDMLMPDAELDVDVDTDTDDEELDADVDADTDYELDADVDADTNEPDDTDVDADTGEPDEELVGEPDEESDEESDDESVYEPAE